MSFTTDDAYAGMLLTAPALTIGYLTVVWRRRAVGRPATKAEAGLEQLVGQT